MSEIEELRAQLASLHARLDALEGEAKTVAPGNDDAPRRITRRGLLATAVAGGAGLIATQVTTAAPAAAAAGGNVVLGALNDGGGTITTVRSSTGINSSPFAVVNPNPNHNSIGLVGNLGAQTGRFDGTSWQRAAVVGESRDDTGVTGLSTYSPGVYGSSVSKAGVQGESVEAYGVYGYCEAGIGVVASTSGDQATALLATAAGGAAVTAQSSSGYGVVATGARAPILLTPSATRGAPKTGTHQRGELFVDAVGTLLFCVRAGTPGAWKRVAFE